MVEHIPVMINEVVEHLKQIPVPRVIVDATLGLGGYAESILTQFPDVLLIGVDRDEQALSMARDRLAAFGDRVHYYLVPFSRLVSVLEKEKVTPDGVVFDLGVSNLQLSLPERGFSFQQDGPLDMRMESSKEVEGLRASDVVNTFSEKDLADIFWKYGEERYSRRIASGIVRYRKENGQISTTAQLVEAIRASLPAPVQRKMGGHPARKVFQALRIFVNNELVELEEGLQAAIEKVADKGVIIVVSYHSLEDRIVKYAMRDWKNEGKGIILTRHPLIPTEKEIEENYKARSAKFRAFMREVDMEEDS
ncbi:16S rRNA (cytosine(1402)-N(4))-methyltransferase RsmH [Aminobacterium mobile]|jgi:16S rRNA (cytosine1402-N4)-methyltransferase|uniref:16S rRNA (cytosine(1402)-N(4))-methyltransferase RsmH n=1 Tax=Aminobacterium mobile TaxID=81467 RepID=UPI0004631347|nr:16S rRNA (cytosine(1402)-N(4))-methyltransferase RsmH [Aminobacterium mobile]